MSRIFLTVTKEQKKDFKELAKKKGVTMCTLFRIILNQYKNESQK